jgi:rubrerythrin
MMEMRNAAVIEGLKQAMQAEADGHNFYVLAAKSTKDKKGKEVFLSLAKDEAEHLEYLKAQYQSFLKSGGPDSKIKLGKAKARPGKSPIFSSDFKKRLGKAQLEMSSLSIGAQLELNAILFYKTQSENADDQIVKAFFAELAEWESGHYELLVRQQQLLQEDFWLENRFFPS